MDRLLETKVSRGGWFINELFNYQNFLFLYGCSPNMGVLAKTTMIKDIVDVFLNRFDRSTFSVLVPDIFDDLKGKDANFEMVASNTL